MLQSISLKVTVSWLQGSVIYCSPFRLDLKLHQEGFVPFFETVIRYLGGLLSAYALSKDPSLLSLADDLGTRLLPAMNTSSGFPMYAVNPQT